MGLSATSRRLAETLSPLDLGITAAAFKEIAGRYRLLLLTYAKRLADSKAAGDGKYTELQFQTDVLALLALSYLGSFIGAGGRPTAGSSWASEAAMTQAPFVANFASDIARGRYDETPDANTNVTSGTLNEDALLGRADLYSGGIWTGAQRGAVSGVEPTMRIKWITEGDNEVCDLCDQRDGQIYTPATLPGFPGEGGFGQICAGGPQCRCRLEVVQ